MGEKLTRRIAVPVDLRSEGCLECVKARRLPAERVLPLKQTFLLNRVFGVGTTEKVTKTEKTFHLELSLAGLDYERLKFLFVEYAPHLALGYLGDNYENGAEFAKSVPQPAFALRNASATSETLRADVVFDFDAFLADNENDTDETRENATPRSARGSENATWAESRR